MAVACSKKDARDAKRLGTTWATTRKAERAEVYLLSKECSLENVDFALNNKIGRSLEFEEGMCGENQLWGLGLFLNTSRQGALRKNVELVFEAVDVSAFIKLNRASTGDFTEVLSCKKIPVKMDCRIKGLCVVNEDGIQ